MTASFPLSNAATSRSPLANGQTIIRNGADPQSTLANRLSERLGLPTGSLSGKQADYSPEAVADRVLGFIDQRLQREAAAGADPAKLQSLLEQARAGVEKGFGEARKILDNMGALQGKVASDIDDTYQRIQSGFSSLDKLYGGTSSGSGSTTGVASSSQRLVAQAETFELDITTREGDRLRVSIAQASGSWSSRNASGSESGSVQIGSWQVQVDGDLNDQEKAALEKLFTQVQDISSSFYSGDLAGAFDRAMALDMDSSQLASMSLRLTQTSVRQATDTYGSVSGEGGQAASAVNGALNDYAQSLLDALRTADQLTGDGKGLLQQLLAGGFSLDERFDAGRLDKAEQLNGRLLDGLQGLLASSLDPGKAEDSAN